MSDRRRTNTEPGRTSPFALLVDWYHVVVVLAAMAYMLWVRTRSYERFVKGDEIFFSGNDPYYHLREVTYTVKHWPATMPFDPWTNFPQGTSVNQFGTLYDQLIATAALVWGLGDPSQVVIAKTLLLAPAVFGTAVAIPAFLMGRRLGGRFGGIFGVVVLALLPGSFLRRSLVGFSDHHIAEAFFQATAVLAIMVTLTAAEQEKPVYELLVDRDLDTLRKPLGWAGLAGIGMALYVWTWPPGVLLFAIAGAFFVVKLSARYLNGYSPEPVALVGVTSMTVAGVLTLLPINQLSFAPTRFGLLQPGFAFGVAAGCAFMAWLAREFDAREFDRRLYPVTVFGTIGLSVVVLWAVLPDVFSLMLTNFKRFVGFTAGAQSRTIGEAQPFLSRTSPRRGITAFDVIFREYGAMFYVAIVSLGYMLVRPLVRSRDVRRQSIGLTAVAVVAVVWQFNLGGPMADFLPLVDEPVLWEMALVATTILVTMLLGDHESEKMFVAVWALFVTAAAFTQVRFNYYLAVAVVVLAAAAVGQLMRLLGVVTDDGSLQTDVEPYQVMALFVAILVIMPGLIVSVQIGSGRSPATTVTAAKVGNSTGPSQITKWEGTLEWMKNNTPKEGQFGGANNTMQYYGTYRPPGDGDFDYPKGAYGVMSWWDYGHWITTEARRIPVANPFQQHATAAANFLLAPNESAARKVLKKLGSKGEDVRYVVVDWKMVSPRSKFTAPIVFYDASNVSRSDFVVPVYGPRGQLLTYRKTQRYYESLMVRLYKYHGSAVRAKPFVLQWTDRKIDGRIYNITQRGQPVVKKFKTVKAARAYARNHSNAMVGGYGRLPNEYVPALEHYRLVKVSKPQANRLVFAARRLARFVQNMSIRQFIKQPSWVKVFERVEGAKVVGHAPPNSTVTASVRLKMTSINKTFVYYQKVEVGPDGKFTMVLPYSTIGYGNFGPKNGHTNVSVRATGPYRFTTNTRSNNSSVWVYQDRANISERKVLGLNDSAKRVNLTKTVLFSFGDKNNSTQGNKTAPPSNNTTNGNKTAPPANNTTDGNQTAPPANDTNESVASRQAPWADGPDAARPAEGTDLPADTATRSGLLLLVIAGLLIETRD